MKKFLRCIALLLVLISLIFFSGCPEPGTDNPMGDLADDLVGSVWGGETPRPGDWLTISFMSAGKVICSFSIDNTSNRWDYTYDNSTNTGTITNPYPPPDDWNPAPNGFTISDDTLTITNYGFHGGAPRQFKRYR
jgi:hypothetical protein